MYMRYSQYTICICEERCLYVLLMIVKLNTAIILNIVFYTSFFKHDKNYYHHVTTTTSAKCNRTLHQPDSSAVELNIKDTDNLSLSTPKHSYRTRQSKQNSKPIKKPL